MKEYFLPKKTLFLWQIRTFIFGGIIFGLCAFYYARLKFLMNVAIVTGLLMCLFVFWYLPSFYKRCRIRFINGAVIVKKGVLIRNTHVFPFSRLIYTQTLTTPLAKRMELTALTLKAARSRIFIPEITKTNAREIISALARDEEQ